MEEKFKEFTKEIERDEAEARVKEKDWARLLKEDMAQFKTELVKNVKTL